MVSWAQAQAGGIQGLTVFRWTLIKMPALVFPPKVLSKSYKDEDCGWKMVPGAHGTPSPPPHSDQDLPVNALGPPPLSSITGDLLFLGHVSKTVYLFISLEEKYSVNQRYH